MAASIEKSLYIGFLKTRFDLFDDIKLVLKGGDRVIGQIINIEDNYIEIGTEDGDVTVYPDEIEDYVN